MQSWDEWVSALNDETRDRAEKLLDSFVRRGAREPESWARSEMNEDIAQTTRYLFLSATWRRMEWAVQSAIDSGPARHLVASGCDAAKLECVMKKIALDLAFDLIYLLDQPDGTRWHEGETQRADIEPLDRRWVLMETEPDGTLTGRDVGGLHESLSDTDPSGNEAADWVSS